MKRDHSCSYFIYPALAFLLLSGFFLWQYSKTEIHLWLNGFHSPWADILFKYVTHLGDGAIFALALPFAIFKNLRSFFVIGFTGIWTLVLTGLLKKVIFQGAPRPSNFLAEYDLYYVPGVELHSINSFPSGHTMAAFGIYFALCLIVQRKLWSVLFVILAILVGYSRMYLSQHFLIDVLVGAIIGLIGAWLVNRLVQKWNWRPLEKNLLQMMKKDV